MTKRKIDYKQLIVGEFETSVELMKASKNPDDILFYFSSTYAVLQRVFNFQFNPHLVFAHLILLGAYQAIKVRLDAIKAGETTVLLKQDLFDRLIALLEEFAQRIKQDKEAYDILEKISLLGFSTTGNGFYLMRKGLYTI